MESQNVEIKGDLVHLTDSSGRVLRDTRRAQGTHWRRASLNTGARGAHLFSSFLAVPGRGDQLRERPTRGGGTRQEEGNTSLSRRRCDHPDRKRVTIHSQNFGMNESSTKLRGAVPMV